jgi:hypothetical protein
MLTFHSSQVLGIMPLGTSMDYESADSRTKGCWDPAPILTPILELWSTILQTPDFIVDDVWCEQTVVTGLGQFVTTKETEFWKKTMKDVYNGDKGRKKIRMSVICLLGRDGLLFRLRDVRCPVYWLQVSQTTCLSYVLLLSKAIAN